MQKVFNPWDKDTGIFIMYTMNIVQILKSTVNTKQQQVRSIGGFISSHEKFLDGS